MLARIASAMVTAAEDAPCPIRGLRGGFHDTDDDWTWSAHRASLNGIPRRLVRPSNTAIRQAKRAARRAD